jgi:hypothetical protein
MAQNPREPYPQIIARLLNGTDPIPALAGKCVTGGRLNVRKSLFPPIRLAAVPQAIPGLGQFRVVSSPQRSCIVESSSDLAHWFPILTNLTSVTGTFDFTYSGLTNVARQFYRAQASP